MEFKDHPDDEKVTPDDSQPTDRAESEVENNQERALLKSEANDDELDLDLRPADTYLGPDYDPKKSSGSKSLWLGIFMVAAVIGLTYYAFRSHPDPALEYGNERVAQEAGEMVLAESASEQHAQLLPEKTMDAADFSPAPVTESSAEPIATAPTPAGTPVVTPAPATVKPKTTANADIARKAATQKAKPAETKPTSTEMGAISSVGTETKASTSPALHEEIKIENTTSSPVEAKAAAAEAEQQPDIPRGNQEAAKASATTPAEPVVVNVSDFWVVNISSTPDPAESLRLLNRVMTADVNGQVYFYEVTLDGRVYHRIRIGFFDSQGEAEAVGQRVKEAFQLSANPWAVKPTVEEVARYRKTQ